MIVQKMKCPNNGCENATFSESVKSTTVSNNNLLLDSEKQNSTISKRVKVYTCNCCNISFEIKENNNSGKMVL